MPGEYSLSLRFTRENRLRVAGLCFQWPRAFQPPRSLLANAIRLIESNPQTCLARIDRLLRLLHQTGTFLGIVSQLARLCPSFNARLTRHSSPDCVCIHFSKQFSSRGRFVLRLKSGRFFVASASIVAATASSPPHCFFHEILPRDFHPAALLTFLRDHACESQLNLASSLLNSSLRLVPRHDLTVTRTQHPLRSILDKLAVSFPFWPCLTIAIDPWSGFCLAHIPRVVRAGEIVFTTQLFPEITALPAILRSAIMNIVTRAATSGLALQLPVNAPRNDNLLYIRYLRRYSFAPDFELRMAAQSGRPRITILDRDGQPILTPEEVQMDYTWAYSSWPGARYVLAAAKRFVFVAQTRLYLKEAGIASTLRGELLDIEIPLCSSATLTCGNEGWQFALMSLPLTAFGDSVHLVKVHGCFSSRCAAVVARLASGFFVWCGSSFHVRVLAEASPILSADIDHDAREMFLRIDGYFTVISLANLCATQYRDGKCRVCRVLNSFHPRFSIRSAPPLLGHFLPKPEGVSQLSAFIHLAAIPVLRLAKQFDRQTHWAMMPLLALRNQPAVCLVYKERYAVTLFLNTGAPCVLAVPRNGMTSMLIVGFVNWRLLRSEPLGSHIMHVQLDALYAVRKVIEKFGDLFDSIQEARFAPLVLSQDFKATKTQSRIGSRVVQLVATESKIAYEVVGCETITKGLNDLVDKADNWSAFVAGAARRGLCKCFSRQMRICWRIFCAFCCGWRATLEWSVRQCKV